MRGRWIVLLVVPQWIAAAPNATDVTAARATIERCAQHADAGLHGLDALRGACPGVDSAARGLGLGALVASDWESRVDVGALSDLGALAERYAQPMPRATPDAARLRAIARALEPPARPLSWLERLKAWIDHWLETNSSRWPDWLRPHWSLNERFWNTLAYILAAAIVLAAVVVAVIQVRAARVPGRSGPSTPRQYPAGGAVAEDRLPELSAIAAAPMRERAVLVLHLLVGALARSQRLRRDRNLTCRELVTAARFDSAAQREKFRGLALLAEEALYGESTSLSASEASATVRGTDLESVKSLYEGLLAMPAEASPTPS